MIRMLTHTRLRQSAHTHTHSQIHAHIKKRLRNAKLHPDASSFSHKDAKEMKD